MFTDMYKTFENENIPYQYQYSFNKDSADYLSGNKPTYEMDYGDTMAVPFQISCEYINCNIDIVLYNFRFEEIYRSSTCPDETGKVYLNLDYETSGKYLKSGTYYIRVQAYCPLQNGSTYVMTLVSPEDCSIWVR